MQTRCGILRQDEPHVCCLRKPAQLKTTARIATKTVSRPVGCMMWVSVYMPHPSQRQPEAISIRANPKIASKGSSETALNPLDLRPRHSRLDLLWHGVVKGSAGLGSWDSLKVGNLANLGVWWILTFQCRWRGTGYSCQSPCHLAATDPPKLTLASGPHQPHLIFL